MLKCDEEDASVRWYIDDKWLGPRFRWLQIMTNNLRSVSVSGRLYLDSVALWAHNFPPKAVGAL